MWWGIIPHIPLAVFLVAQGVEHLFFVEGSIGYFGEDDSFEAMPFQDGTLIYQRTTATSREYTGFYILQKLWPNNAKDARYGMVNRAKRLEISDPRDKARWTTRRPGAGMTVHEFPGLTSSEKAAMMDGLVRVREREQKRVPKKDDPKGKGGKRDANPRDRMARRVLSSVSWGAGTIYSYKMIGCIGALGFISWRAYEYFEIGEKIERAQTWGEAAQRQVEETGIAMREAVDEVYDAKEDFLIKLGWLVAILFLVRILVIPLLVDVGLLPRRWFPWLATGAGGDNDSAWESASDVDFGANASDSGESLILDDMEEGVKKDIRDVSGKLDKLCDVLTGAMQGGGLSPGSSAGATAGSVVNGITASSAAAGAGEDLSVDALLGQLRRHQDVVDMDREKRGSKQESKKKDKKKKKKEKKRSRSSSASSESDSDGTPRDKKKKKKKKKKAKKGGGSGSSSSSSGDSSDSESERLKEEIRKLKSESADPRAELLRRLRAWRRKVRWEAPGSVKSRVSPKLLSFLFKGGFSACENLRRWAEAKGVLEHPAIRTLTVICAAFDKMMLSKAFIQMMNEESVELLSRRVWGTMRAFDGVSCKGDWQKPSGGAQSWKSKINWSVLEEVDIIGASRDSIQIPHADDELRKRFRDRALLERATPSGASGDDPGF
jgi:hypothetical protein